MAGLQGLNPFITLGQPITTSEQVHYIKFSHGEPKFYRIKVFSKKTTEGFIEVTRSASGQRKILDIARNIFSLAGSYFKNLAKDFATASHMTVFASVFGNVYDLVNNVKKFSHELSSSEKTALSVFEVGQKTLNTGGHVAKNLLQILTLIVRVLKAVLAQTISILGLGLSVWDFANNISTLAQAVKHQKETKIGSEEDLKLVQAILQQEIQIAAIDVFFDVFFVASVIITFACGLAMPQALALALLIIGLINLIGTCANKVYQKTKIGSLEEIKDKKIISQVQLTNPQLNTQQLVQLPA